MKTFKDYVGKDQINESASAEGDVIHDWADGNASFDNIWDNRASLKNINHGEVSKWLL